MTTYNRSDRRHWRHTLRRVAWRVNLLLAVLALALVVASTPARAAPRCPGGTATPQGCIYQPDPLTVCAWPARLVRLGKVAVCIRQAAEVQP